MPLLVDFPPLCAGASETTGPQAVDRARAWRGHGKGMARAWQGHGCPSGGNAGAVARCPSGATQAQLPDARVGQRRRSCPMCCRKARPRLTDLVGAARQAPSGVASLSLRGSCPVPFGPASPFAPLSRRSGGFSLAIQRKIPHPRQEDETLPVVATRSTYEPAEGNRCESKIRIHEQAARATRLVQMSPKSG